MDLGESQGGLPPDSLVEDRDTILAETEALIERGVEVAVSPCSPFSVTKELMIESAELARRHGVALHTHLAETVEEEAYCQELYGCTPVEYLEEVGWIADDVWCAHCVHLSDDDVRLFGERGVGVAHCPTSNLRLGAGIAKVRELLDAKAPVGLGVDGSASNERSDLSFEVKQALLVARARQGPLAMTTRDALATGDARRRERPPQGRHRVAGARQAGGHRRLAHRRPSAGGRRRSGGRVGAVGAPPGRPALRRRRGGRPRRSARESGRGRDRAGTPRPGAKIPSVSVSLSTHVLDTGKGEPARGVRVELLRGSDPVGSGETDDDGRVSELAADLDAGDYRLVFHPPSPFFRRVELELSLEDGHYHVPLLVSEYGCATYRGS